MVTAKKAMTNRPDQKRIHFTLWKPGPYLGFFVCGGKLGFREISDQYSYKKQPSKIRHYVRKKTFSFPGGGNCPLRPPAMYGPGNVAKTNFFLLLFQARFSHARCSSRTIERFRNWGDHGKPKGARSEAVASLPGYNFPKDMPSAEELARAQ